jgi:ATP-dependent exoDNAse (exonuclease V) alpha subunit
MATDHEQNKITVRLFNGRELSYNPSRLSGVSVYYEAERTFAEGDRLQIRALFRAKRIANGSLERSRKSNRTKYVWLWTADATLRLTFASFRHLDYGYAVTSHSAQGLTFDRVFVNADTHNPCSYSTTAWLTLPFPEPGTTP